MNSIKLFTFFITMIIFLLGCEKGRKEVEIVPDLESIYLNQYIVDVPAKVKEGFNTKAEQDLIDAVKTLDATAPINFKIYIRVFIDENGNIDKIRDISNDYRLNAYPDSINNYKQVGKLMEAIVGKLSDWQFEPAKDRGKNVKCWCDFKANVHKRHDGTYKFEMSEFLSDMPDINDFIPVDKMPQVNVSIPPKYPEQAKREGIDGTVYIKLLVNKEGKPIRSVVMRSDNEIFNQPALDAAMKFEFAPAIKNERAIVMWVVIPFKFKLDK